MIPKFRCWDKDEEEMLAVHGINFDAKGLWTKEAIDDGDDGGFIFFDDIILMQSTGLLDINDKEIYIGDLVKCDISDNIIRDCAYEVFDNGFELVLKSKFGNWPLVRYIDYIEILGNIFQNPNLLEADSHE